VPGAFFALQTRLRAVAEEFIVDNRNLVCPCRMADKMFAQSEFHGFRTVHGLWRIVFVPLGVHFLLAYELNLDNRFLKND
jgi:hypothetical protein